MAHGSQRISRRRLVGSALCGAALAAAGIDTEGKDFPMHSGKPSGARPNILWISSEDINPDLGCYSGVYPGAEYARTPHLDRLASEGARFDLAFAVSPVCAACRSSIITGMYPTAIGTMHMRSRGVPPPEVRCFPEYLRAAGYYCTNNSKTDYNFESPVTAWDECSTRAHWRSRPSPETPFFAVFNLLVTHESQIRVPDDIYERNMQGVPAGERHDPARAPIPPYYPDTPAVRKDWARYSDNITAMDQQAAAILRQLQEDGLVDNTVVFFWGDHGRGLPRAKRWPYDSGLRVPLIVRWPGKVEPASARTDLVTLMDLSATTLSVAGVPIPTHMHARPFYEADGRPPAHPRAVVFGHRDRMDEACDTVRSVRDARYRYIRNLEPDKPYAQHVAYGELTPTMQELRRLHAEEAAALGRGEMPALLTEAQRLFMAPRKPAEELYDLREDPHEVRNLARDPAHSAVLKRLRKELDRWMRECGDLGLTPEADLIERFRPGGEWRVTGKPTVRLTDGRIVASCPTPGASIAFTFDPPESRPAQPRPPTGEPATARKWLLYSAPIIAKPGTRVWFRACRLGYRDSEDVELAT